MMRSRLAVLASTPELIESAIHPRMDGSLTPGLGAGSREGVGIELELLSLSRVFLDERTRDSNIVSMVFICTRIALISAASPPAGPPKPPAAPAA